MYLEYSTALGLSLGLEGYGSLWECWWRDDWENEEIKLVCIVILLWSFIIKIYLKFTLL